MAIGFQAVVQWCGVAAASAACRWFAHSPPAKPSALPMSPGKLKYPVVTGTLLALWLSCSPAATAPAVNGPLTTVLIVSGISKDPNDQATRSRAAGNLRDFLIKHMNVDPQRLMVLTGDTSTATQIATTMDTLAATIRSEDRFIFYYLGQANAAGEDLRFNLPGPDITQKELAERLKAIKAGAQLVVLDCPCAALAAKTLTGPNRIIVCASTPTQTYGTQFTPHFVRVLAQRQTDANADSKGSLLGAFAATVREIEQWYRQKGLLPTETPCLEDNGDGIPTERPWKHETEGGDGLKASTFLLGEGN